MGELSRARSVIALASLIAVSCGHSPTTTTQDPSPQPVPADIQQVCANFVTTALSVDTTTDHSPADARRRAAQAFGNSSMASASAGEGRDPDWALLADHHALVAVSVRSVSDDPPPITGDHAAAGVEVSRVAVGRDGWRHPLPGAVAYCSLRRTETGWKVTELALSHDGIASDGP